jgi:predicted nucleotide-binding protein
MKPTFLVADDDPVWQQFFARLLYHLDADCTVVSNWTELYSKLSRDNPERSSYQGIILDLGLGVEATLSMSELTSLGSLTKLPILVTTATPDNSAQLDLAKRSLAVAGVRHFVVKPRIFDSLKDVIEFVGIDKDASSLAESILQGNVSLRPVPKYSRNTDKMRRVFVVHGHDERARRGLFEFLRSLDLLPLGWTKATGYAERPASQMKEGLEGTLQGCGAVVVLLTPDDEVVLRTALRNRVGEERDRETRSQARPNVFVELGMAIASVPERVVIVEIGSPKVPAEIEGMQRVRLSDSSESREELAKRLELCGCPVQMHGSDWLTAGALAESN